MNFELRMESVTEVAKLQTVLVGGQAVGEVALRKHSTGDRYYHASLYAFTGAYGLTQGFGPSPAAAIAAALANGRQQAQRLAAGIEDLAARLGEGQ